MSCFNGVCSSTGVTEDAEEKRKWAEKTADR